MRQTFLPWVGGLLREELEVGEEGTEEGTKEGATKAAPAESASPYWFVRWWTKFMSTIGSGGMTSSEETRAYDGGLGGGAPSLLARRRPTRAACRAARPLR